MILLAWAVFAAAVFAVVANVAYMRRHPRGEEWWFRFFITLGLMPFTVLYYQVASGQFSDPAVYAQVGPTVLRSGVLLLLLIEAAEAVRVWRK